MAKYPKDFEYCFSVTAEILEEEGLPDAANLLESPDYKIGEAEYVDLNDETPTWKVYLQIDPREYIRLGEKKDTLVDQINRHLSPILEREIGGWYSVAIIPKVGPRPNDRSVSRARIVADALDADWMHKEIDRIEQAIDTDPALALGTAKELLESCCKTILTKCGVSFSRSDDLPKLTKALTKEIKLVPDGIPDEAKGAEKIKLILRNLSALAQYMAELRGLYGSGHGRDGKHKGLEPRHARLAFASAVAFIDFVTETYHQRIDVSDSDKPPQKGAS